MSPTEEPPIGCKTLFVKNLPYDITEEGIRTLFQKYGRIDQVRMVYDAFHKHFKGFCFIDYSSPSSLKGGLKMNGAEFQGRRLIAVRRYLCSDLKLRDRVKVTNPIANKKQNDVNKVSGALFKAKTQRTVSPILKVTCSVKCASHLRLKVRPCSAEFLRLRMFP